MKYIKLSLFSLLLMMLIGVNVLADSGIRSEDNNYGVNKSEIVISASNKSNILNTPMVDASEKIYDYADILDEEEEAYLKDLIDEFIKETNMDMVILTDSRSYLYDTENEDYAADFYDYNDFGLDFELYSGVLLYRNAYSADPYYNVYHFGNAQLYYSYSRSEMMLDDIYNYMVMGRYKEAFSTFIREYKSYYEMGIPSDMASYYVDSMGYLQQKYVYPWVPALIVSAIVTVIYFSVNLGRNKMIKKAKLAQDYIVKDEINVYKQVDQFVNSHTSSYTVSSSSGGSGGGGGSSHSGSSGMGHSSGGGRHG